MAEPVPCTFVLYMQDMLGPLIFNTLLFYQGLFIKYYFSPT